MKVGIISINMYSKGLNFACPVHSYAFQQFLTRNGIESVVIDYKPVYYDNFDLKYPFDYYTVKMNKCQKKLKSAKNRKERNRWEEKIKYFQNKLDAWQPLYNERASKYDKFQQFIDDKYVKTDICYDSDLLEIMDPECDAYICATDVIWKNQPNSGFDRGYFLGSTCMENKFKFSYAASRGVYFADNQEEEDLFFHYLEDIDTITVREESLKNYIEENSSLKATRVLDPVLLHEKEFYDNIIKRPEEEKYLLLYYVMEQAKDTISYAVDYARKHNLKIVEITEMPEKEGRLGQYKDIEHVYRYDIGIEDWLGYLKHAECIFTNSFHACCFSILFQKDFYVGSRHGDKVTNVIDTFGLRARLLADNPKIIQTGTAPIDYEAVQKILDVKRKESADFILSAIKNCEGKKKEKDYSIYKKSLQYPITYTSKLKNKPFEVIYDKNKGTIHKSASGEFKYSAKQLLQNDGDSHVEAVGFKLEGYKFRGWNIKFMIDHRWFYYLKDGSIVEKSAYNKKEHGPLYLVKDKKTIPYIPVNRISKMTAEAVWKKKKGAELESQIVEVEVKKKTLWDKIKNVF